MAVTAYTGIPGSGKSYEVVTTVILEGLRTGRRCVTNVRGVDVEEMSAYLVERGTPADKLGSLVLIDNDAISAPDFFPHAGRDASGVVIQPGDLVVLDEVWRWWATGMKFPAEHMQFFREHRHMVNSAGVSCDVVLVVQSISDLDRKLKVLVASTYHMEKLTVLGFFGRGRYRVDVFTGGKERGRPIRQIFRTYNKDFFRFYQSYAAGKGGDERTTDKRANIFSNSLVLIGVPVGLVVMGLSVWSLVSFFKGGSLAAPKGAETPAAQRPGSAPPPGSPKAAQAARAPAPAATTGPKPFFLDQSAPSSAWRLVGVVGADSYMIQKAGTYRIVGPSGIQRRGSELIIDVDGERVTWWTGSSGSASHSLVR